MVNHDKSRRLGLRAALSAALLLAATSASAVTVDGNLSDLITAVGSAPYNAYTASDPMGSADSPTTESNNGFDISNVYSFYDVATDTLYLGMSVYGKVGDSRAVTDTTSAYEKTSAFGALDYYRTVFDANENYRISLFKGTSISDPQLLSYNVQGINGATPSGDQTFSVSNPYSLGVTRSVSITNNGVEFSITGLKAQLDPFSFSNPADLLIFFAAGSGDVNPVSSASEDTHLLQMQVVPVPAAVWLFGSGLLGLVGVSARKHHNISAAV